MSRSSLSPPRRHRSRSETRVRVPDTKHSRSQSTQRAPLNSFTFSKGAQDELDHVSLEFPLDTQSISSVSTLPLAEGSGIALSHRSVLTDDLPTSASVYSPLHYRRANQFFNHRFSSVSTTPTKVFVRPEWVLEAPGIDDDFYLNTLCWNCRDIIALAIRKHVYLWKVGGHDVVHLQRDSHHPICSVDFSNDGQILALGLKCATVELWDLETESMVRKISSSSSWAAIMALSWNQHILTSGCQEGIIWNYDVRMGRPLALKFQNHDSTICGLKWSPHGSRLASSCDDGVINIWDCRVGDIKAGSRGVSRWTNDEHGTAVKALAWCPWEPSLLASGGGLHDGKIHFWDTKIERRVHTLDMGDSAQVTSIQWSPHQKEFVVTFGYSGNSVVAFRYPTMEQILDIKNAHSNRILWSAVGPLGDILCTGSSDRALKFWKIWEVNSRIVVEGQ